MAQPFVGELRMFGGSFAPAGWMMCDGQLLPISEYDTLFNLIGTTYGGDGQSTFGLPDLRGRLPLHMGTGSSGTNYQLASTGGVETVMLTQNQIPNHTHPIIADNNHATTGAPDNAYYAAAAPNAIFSVPNDPNNPSAPNYQNFKAQILPVQGGSQPHENLQPFLAVTFIISLFGLYPSPT
jgi:microcystin-dependent protein